MVLVTDVGYALGFEFAGYANVDEPNVCLADIGQVWDVLLSEPFKNSTYFNLTLGLP